MIYEKVFICYLLCVFRANNASIISLHPENQCRIQSVIPDPYFTKIWLKQKYFEGKGETADRRKNCY